MTRSSKITVLHIDDERDVVELAASYLTREDSRIDVLGETDPHDGLERLTAEAIDCIVSDYQMPELDGLELLKAVREVHPDLPFILFTGKGSEEIASEAITAGVTDYIQKGGSERYAMLANRITSEVERHRAMRQTRLGHRAMDTATEGISLVRPDGTFSYANSAFEDLFGYEHGELLDEHWTTLYHDEEAERLENHILPAVAEKGYWSGETVRLTKHGERLVTDHRLAYTDQEVIVCTAKDVTDERSENLAHTTAFDLLTETIGDYAFYTLDHEGYVTRWSEEAKRLTGYDVEDILGRHVSVLYTEADRQRGIPEEQFELARRDGSVTDEGWRLREDGSRFWADVTISASYTDAGTLRGFGTLLKEAPQQPTT